MSGKLDAALAFTLAPENEGGYQSLPSDPGNLWRGELIGTNLGISAPVLADWLGPAATVAAVHAAMIALTVADATPIYGARYWNPVHGDALPDGVGLSVFDQAVNSGVAASARILQGCVWVTADGWIGPETLAAANATSAFGLIAALADAQEAFYRGLGEFPEFGRGWLSRTQRRRARAMVIAQGAP